jgi:hypothetical protein
MCLINNSYICMVTKVSWSFIYVWTYYIWKCGCYKFYVVWIVYIKIVFGHVIVKVSFNMWFDLIRRMWSVLSTSRLCSCNWNWILVNTLTLKLVGCMKWEVKCIR